MGLKPQENNGGHRRCMGVAQVVLVHREWHRLGMVCRNTSLPNRQVNGCCWMGEEVRHCETSWEFFHGTLSMKTMQPQQQLLVDV